MKKRLKAHNRLWTQEIILFLYNMGESWASEISRNIKKSQPVTSRQLKTLVDEGLLVRVKKDIQVKNASYFTLTKNGTLLAKYFIQRDNISGILFRNNKEILEFLK